MAPLMNLFSPSSILTLASLLTLAHTFATIKPRSSNCFPSENSTASTVEWNTCPPELDMPETLQCATFSVPIDWDAPYGEHFDLGLVKLPAVPSSNFTKVGFLFINPGGPGGSAAKLVGKLALGILPAEALFSSFDIIGLDPRGVGLSSQVQCNMSIYAERVTLFPETDEEYEALVDKNKRLGESFRELTGPLLEHLDTISTAKDHEAHSQSEATNLLIETSSYELVLTHFFEWAAMNESSALQGQNDIQGLWTSLLDNATETPIPALSCNGTHCRSDVNAEEMVFNVQSYLAFEVDRGFGASWELLASAIYNASQGDASALSTSFSNFEFFSFLGIGCLDWKRSDTAVSMVQAKREMTNTYAPLVRGASSMWKISHACLSWPIEVKNPP